jgi:beta-phosphoglucomutase-like phosphatase (HAD superfamily)
MAEIAQYLTTDDAARLLAEEARALGTDELIAVRNLGFIPTARELYLLAPHSPLPLASLAAIAVDMDGTSTTTETLALHALEYMVRRVTGRITAAQWAGLDREKDVPFVIGNSNFRHTEFLLQRYADALDIDAFRAGFIEALLWTLGVMKDRLREGEIRRTAANCGLSALLDDPAFRRATRAAHLNDETCAERVQPFLMRYGAQFQPPHVTAQVAAALDIYYYRYHAILKRMAHGSGAHVAAELLGDQHAKLVAPMPGYGIFLCLVKGWLDERAAALAACLRAAHPRDTQPRAEDTATFLALCRHFQRAPVKLALVTASIAFEAQVVMREVIRLIRADVADWPVPPALRRVLRARLRDYRTIFDGFVTATDASEARLKPHRDLYSISVQQMGVARSDIARCMAIEDTEPGILSARAAGFGVSVALPNHDTSRQNYAKASRVVAGGLPELILDHAMLLQL